MDTSSLVTFIILSFLTLINIGWIMFDYLNGVFDKGKTNSVKSLFINVIFIGWIVIGVLIPQRTEKIDIKQQLEIAKFYDKVIVYDGERIWEFDKYNDYININDSTLFYYEIGYNMYGFKNTLKQLKFNY